MAHCVLAYRDRDVRLNEDRLIDAMAIVLRTCQDWSANRDFARRFSEVWIEYVHEFGGCGILDCPFDDWFPASADADAFVHFIDVGVKKIAELAPRIPLDLIQNSVSEPGRFSEPAPVEPYIEVLQTLKSLFVNRQMAG